MLSKRVHILGVSKRIGRMAATSADSSWEGFPIDGSQYPIPTSQDQKGTHKTTEPKALNLEA